MRGSTFHNQVLVRSLDLAFRSLGACPILEHPAGPGRSAGYVDLFIELGACRIVCEAEQTADRVGRDLEKARLLSATHLLIVTPTARVKRDVLRRLHSPAIALPSRSVLHIEVHALGVAIARLNDFGSFCDQRVCPDVLIPKTPPRE